MRELGKLLLADVSPGITSAFVLCHVWKIRMRVTRKKAVYTLRQRPGVHSANSVGQAVTVGLQHLANEYSGSCSKVSSKTCLRAWLDGPITHRRCSARHAWLASPSSATTSHRSYYTSSTRENYLHTCGVLRDTRSWTRRGREDRGRGGTRGTRRIVSIFPPRR